MLSARSATRLLGGGLLSLVLLTPGTAAAAAAPNAGKENFDSRRADVASVPARTRDARESFARRSGGATVDADRKTGSVRSVGRTDGLLTGPSSRDEAVIALDYVRDQAALFGIDGTDLASLSQAARYTSPNGVTHISWQQTSRGLDSYDGLLTVNVARDGRVVNVTGSLVHDLDVSSATPDLSASEALAIAQRDVGVSASAPPASIPAGTDRRTKFMNGDTARLVAFADKDGDHLAWRLTVAGEDPYLYDEVIDAATGNVLARQSLTHFANASSVYPYHPGAASGGTATNVDLAPWLTIPAAPTSLTGPNTHTYADVGAPNGFNAGEDILPSSGTDYVYPQTSVTPCGPGAASIFTSICTWQGNSPSRGQESVNRAQTTTQLFYFINNFHDWLATAPIGFTNASHNFELGGIGGSDPVNGEADDVSGFNNANMNTPPDGASPRMQMYLFDDPVVNSGDDAAVVYHEYTHGLSNRLVNNGLGGGLSARQSRAMGEGWSDFYAMDYLVQQGYVTDTAADGEIPLGEYVTNDTNTGVRFNALDCPVGSANATDCPGSAGAGTGGFDFGDMGKVIAYNGDTSFPFFEVHADGEIWAETLWDLRKTIGATAARGLVTEAMRLSPTNPTFLDERDAILLADQVAGGTYHTQIWTVFAARGMGYDATVTSAESTRGQAAFNTPPLSIATAAAPTVTEPAPLGDGDGNAESGETVLLRIPVRNTTGTQLTGVTATLTSSTPGVVVGQPTVVYPNLAVKAVDTGDIPFAVTLPTSLTCATIVSLSLTVQSNQGTSTAQPLTLDLGALSGTTYTSTGVPAAIPDFSLAGATVTLSVPDVATINKLRVTVSTNHSFIGDLHGRLTAPDGTIVELFERAGGGSFGAGISGMNGVVFDDAAPSKIQDLPAWPGGPPTSAISGPYKPNEPLSRLTGHPQMGTWSLRMFDVFMGDTGSITGFAVQSLQGPPACSTTVTPPVLATLPASPVSTNSATLNGTVDPTTANTDYEYQWGLTTAYGNVAGAGTATAGSGSAPHPAAIGPLTPSTTYHYRLVARRAGTVVMLTPDATFTTNAPAATYPTVVAADTPAGYWRFGEASGLTALDSSGNANNGTYLNGPVLGVPGALATGGNTAVRMDGINDTIRVPDANTLDVGDTFSVEGWMKRSSTAQTHTMMIKGFQVVVMNSASLNQVFLRKPNVSTIARSNVGVPAGSYQHIVVTKNGTGPSSVNMYINGAPVPVVYVSAAQVIQDTNSFLIMGDGASTQADFDEFAVYDGVLSPARVAAHYAAGL
jgi:subtilisin-like proprotein convertase family protein